MNPHLHPDTLAVHAGRDVDPHTGAVVPPIHLSTTFARGEDGELLGTDLYSRASNPNRRALEEALAALEGGADAACFASGSAALNALLQTLPPGAVVLIPDDLYHGARTLLTDLFAAHLQTHAAPLHDLGAATQAIHTLRPALVLLESPSNPLLHLTDLQAVAAAARDHGALTLADNTWATPVLQRPLDLGCDLVLHATTKYLGGHSDVLGGALVTADPHHPTWHHLRRVQATAGAVPSPFECWLTLRGLATLPLRVRAQTATAQRLAATLDPHPAVSRVLYPGLPNHPHHALASTQLRAPGAMLSFCVHGGFDAAARAASRLRLILRATSLGGVHSLIEHRRLVEGPRSTTPPDLLRLSVGLEHPDDLERDLLQALS